MAVTEAHLAGRWEARLLNKRKLSLNLWLMIAGFTFFNLFVRWYQAVYGWSVGLDISTPEFKTSWMTWLYIETGLYIPLFAAIGAYLWKTRTRDMNALTAMEILERHFHHLVWLVAYGVTIYWGASFYTEQDAAWHQTVIRDTDFTPSHIIEFYMSYPIYILTGWGAFMYARTRIPCFSKGVSLPYLVVTVGPFMMLPNVGLNGWAHAFSLVEHLVGAALKEAVSLVKCLVMAIKQPLCKRMIVMRSEDTHLMNLAPYEKGITVNLGYLDRPADSWADEAIPMQTIQALGDALYDFLPGIREVTATDSIFYTCQKLNIEGRGRQFYWEQTHNDFFALYPGKFTQCLHAAQWIVNNVLSQYGLPGSHLGSRGSGIGPARLLPSLNHPGSQAAT